MILFQCQSMVSLIARQRLSMLLIWYNVVVREDDSGKGATRQCSRCSGLESAITTDHCSPIVVPHPPSRCLRIRRRREVGSWGRVRNMVNLLAIATRQLGRQWTGVFLAHQSTGLRSCTWCLLEKIKRSNLNVNGVMAVTYLTWGVASRFYRIRWWMCECEQSGYKFVPTTRHAD